MAARCLTRITYRVESCRKEAASFARTQTVRVAGTKPQVANARFSVAQSVANRSLRPQPSRLAGNLADALESACHLRARLPDPNRAPVIQRSKLGKLL